jgi:general secretion pathway protein K
MNTRAKKRNQRGVALILVLGSIAILAVMLTEFQDDTSSELAAALEERDALKAEYLARSGINLSRLLVAAEPTINKAASMLLPLGRIPQIPVWAFADRILGAFNDKEGGEGFAALTGTNLSSGKNLGIEGGKFETTIVDEDSKLDINLAARGDWITAQRLATELLALMAGDQYSPLFEQRDRDDQFSDRSTICGAIVD